MQTPPQNPIAAVTHPNPYPYYAALTADRPLYFDAALGLWVASSAKTVRAVLYNETFRVRPPSEPIPAHLLDSPAAGIYRHLVRMNDGESQHDNKPLVTAALSGIDGDRIIEQAARQANDLIADLQPHLYPDRISEFCFRLSIYTLGGLLGIELGDLPETFRRTAAFVGGLAPTATPEQIEACKTAAGELLGQFGAFPAAMAANHAGFLMQAYEATAGLTGNTVAALVNRSNVRAQIAADPRLFASLVHEVLRFDPSVQNTRRFVAQDHTIAGNRLREGESVLVVLAAANRDPATNPNPDTFNIFRLMRHIFTFGVGAHACAGEHLAVAITAAGVEQLMAAGLYFEQLRVIGYRPSPNTRVPLFGNGEISTP